MCAQALARAHARSGDRVAIASYLGNGPTFDRAIAEFAETYADQNERDYEALRAGGGHRTDHGRVGSLGRSLVATKSLSGRLLLSIASQQ